MFLKYQTFSKSHRFDKIGKNQVCHQIMVKLFVEKTNTNFGSNLPQKDLKLMNDALTAAYIIFKTDRIFFSKLLTHTFSE